MIPGNHTAISKFKPLSHIYGCIMVHYKPLSHDCTKTFSTYDLIITLTHNHYVNFQTTYRVRPLSFIIYFNLSSHTDPPILWILQLCLCSSWYLKKLMCIICHSQEMPPTTLRILLLLICDFSIYVATIISHQTTQCCNICYYFIIYVIFHIILYIMTKTQKQNKILLLFFKIKYFPHNLMV